jgi:ketosteroid isomerase-like protein
VEESLFDPYMVGVYPDPEPIPQYGLEAVREYMRQFGHTFDDMRFEATRFRAANGTVVVDVRRFGIGRQSGVTLEDKVFHVCTFRGGRIIRIDVFDREGQALEAAGLSE